MLICLGMSRFFSFVLPRDRDGLELLLSLYFLRVLLWNYGDRFLTDGGCVPFFSVLNVQHTFVPVSYHLPSAVLNPSCFPSF